VPKHTTRPAGGHSGWWSYGGMIIDLLLQSKICPRKRLNYRDLYGAPAGNRTQDPQIKSLLLYQLSYGRKNQKTADSGRERCSS
jgi:hypothetical protein